MKSSLAIFFLCFFVLVVPCESVGVAQQAQIQADTLSSDTGMLKDKYPVLWKHISEDPKIIGLKGERKNREIVRKLKKMTRGSPAVAEKMNGSIYSENIYIEKKAKLDIARGKLVINPYHTNYIYADRIYDPSPDLKHRHFRGALKWQISVQAPVLTWKYPHTGVFAAFTNRATFDVANKDDSRPVTHKTFMPELFFRYDFLPVAELLGNYRIGIDQITLQVGAQHESNGGVKDSLSLLDSRSIGYKLYGQACLKLFKCPVDPMYRYVREDQYSLMLSARGFKSFSVEQNESIEKYIGYLDLNASYEFIVFRILKWRPGVGKIDAFFAPGGSLDDPHVSYAIGLSFTPHMFSLKSRGYRYLPKLPLTPYVRFFQGYNEYLYFYDKRTTVWGFGLKIRN
ncbi:MAG: phospholipase A [Chitinispirillaceae bacterium]|nr:phospholipase A [Chitinispirillaceae bacterium]